MPLKRGRYPADWDAISRRIRDEAGDRCEQCGVANGAIVERTPGKQTRIVLTVHHIGVPEGDEDYGDPHDKMDCRDENLIALCQLHHFAAHIEINKLEKRWYVKGFGDLARQLGFISDDITAHPCQGPIYNLLRGIAARRASGREDGAEHGAPDTGQRQRTEPGDPALHRGDGGARPLPDGRRRIPIARRDREDIVIPADGGGERSGRRIHGGRRDADGGRQVRADQRKGLPLRQRVLDLLSGAPRPLTTLEISRQLSFSKGAISNVLAVTDTAVETARTKYGHEYRYRITEEGRAALGELRRSAGAVSDQPHQGPSAEVRQ